MYKIETKKYFDRQYSKFIKGNSIRAKRVSKAFHLLLENPKHPSLQTEKLGGKNLYTSRIDKGNRIFFGWKDEQTVILLDIGPHDKYRKY